MKEHYYEAFWVVVGGDHAGSGGSRYPLPWREPSLADHNKVCRRPVKRGLVASSRI